MLAKARGGKRHGERASGRTSDQRVRASSHEFPCGKSVYGLGACVVRIFMLLS